jgi:MATE family, multidrug efflux pump
LFQDNVTYKRNLSIADSIRVSQSKPTIVASPVAHRRGEAFFSELRPTLRLAVPLIIAELGWMAMGIVDTMMVGRLPNSAVAIGAVSLGGGLYYTIAIFGSGLLLGLDTLVAQAFGRKDLADARTSLVNSLILALILAPLMMGVVSLWPPLMLRMHIDPEVLREMGPFLRALNWSTLPLALYFALRRYLQAVGIIKPITFALISANIVNALGNWIFIYGRLGSRAYGLPGSGWSTCAARVYITLVLIGALLYFNKRKQLGLFEPGVRVELQRMWDLLKLGFPAATQILLEIGVFTIATAFIAKLGPFPLAGHQIALNAASFTYMVPLGISSAAAVRVGHAIGRGDTTGARRAGWTAIVVGAAFMSIAALLFISIPTWIARVFSPDPRVIHIGATLLLVAAAFELFDGLQTVATGALRGLGDTRTPMLTNLISYWIIGLPLGYVLCFHFGWGAVGLWIGLCVGLILIGSILLFIWNRRTRLCSE